MIALVFLYYGAWIFVYGIELNAGIARCGGEGVVRVIASFGAGRFGPAA